MSVTDCTVADAFAPVDAVAWSTDVNFEPFWTYFSFVATEFFPSKNVTQFFLIAAIAAAPLVGSPAAAGDMVAVGEAAAVVAGADGEAEADGEVVAAELLELLELLEQAVMVAASAKPNAGTSRLRRAI